MSSSLSLIDPLASHTQSSLAGAHDVAPQVPSVQARRATATVKVKATQRRCMRKESHIPLARTAGKMRQRVPRNSALLRAPHAILYQKGTSQYAVHPTPRVCAFVRAASSARAVPDPATHDLLSWPLLCGSRYWLPAFRLPLRAPVASRQRATPSGPTGAALTAIKGRLRCPIVWSTARQHSQPSVGQCARTALDALPSRSLRSTVIARGSPAAARRKLPIAFAASSPCAATGLRPRSLTHAHPTHLSRSSDDAQ